MLNSPTLEKLSALHLHEMATAWSAQHAQADHTALTFDERFGLLVDAQWLARENRRLQRSLQEARLRLSQVTLEAIEYRPHRPLDKALRVHAAVILEEAAEVCHSTLGLKGATCTGFEERVECVTQRILSKLVASH